MCKTMSIKVENVTIQSSEYPNSPPAARLDAQFPGSINPTVTSSPGPMYLRNLRKLAFGTNLVAYLLIYSNEVAFFGK